VTALDKASLPSKLAALTETWRPRLLARVNDTDVRIARLHGEFIWHAHPDDDEFFLVLEGELLIRLRDQDIHLKEGDFVTIPRGVEHLPVAEQPCAVLLVEPASTVNTGSAGGERTLESIDPI
jgi:mannose-6-phosphate isomerase-like protein (cupin superfamily)